MQKARKSLFFAMVFTLLCPLSSARAIDGMISYWKFDECEGTTATDSFGDNDGTIYGPTWTTEGIVNCALSFDGDDDYVNVGNDTTLTNLTPTGMTIEAWVFNTEPIPTDIGGYYKSIVTQRNSVSQGYGLKYGSQSDIGHFVWIGFYYGYEGIAVYEIEADEWCHIVGAFENDVATIYINGIEQVTWSRDLFPPPGYNSSTDDVMIGRGGNFYQSANGYRNHQGLIDEVKIYNRALTPVVEVDIDIKPGSCPNPLNVKSKGVLPVAILGTEDFDIFDIDVASIRMEGISPIRSGYEDVATPFEGEICECHELGADGYLDLTLKFTTQEIVDAIGDVNDGDEVILSIIGKLSDGSDFAGADCVVITKKSSNKE